MALNIKDSATDELARRLAATTGESITVAVRVSMEERLARIERSHRMDARRTRLSHYIERARERGLRDELPVDEIVGYDEDGLPQ